MTATAVPTPVQNLLDAVNHGDTEAFLECFTPDGVVDDWGREFRGADAVRAWSDAEFIGVEVALIVVEVEVDVHRVTLVAQVGGEGFTGPSTFTFLHDGSRITRMSIRA